QNAHLTFLPAIAHTAPPNMTLVYHGCGRLANVCLILSRRRLTFLGPHIILNGTNAHANQHATPPEAIALVLGKGIISWRMNEMNARMCLLDEDKVCTNCGECERCDLDPNKICDNCMKCVKKSDADYLAIEIDELFLEEEVPEED
ncbi:MAG: hypothetical protein RR452_08095, partial [Clostridia bacterium]